MVIILDEKPVAGLFRFDPFSTIDEIGAPLLKVEVVCRIVQVLVELMDEELFTVQLDLVMKLKAILFSMVDDRARSFLCARAFDLPLTSCLPLV